MSAQVMTSVKAPIFKGNTEGAAPGGLTGARPLVQVRGLTHRYKPAGAAIFSDLSLAVERGEVLAIVGRSGTGKSTLLNIIAGLRRPSSGEVEVSGTVVSGPKPSRILMAQHPALFPWMTVRQNAGLGLRFTGRHAAMDGRISEVLELVELAGYGDRNIQDLSGGQQQRVALARSLAPEPELLLLDEPFSALDPITRTRLQKLVRKTVKSSDLTAILVTHDLAEAAIMADRVLILTAIPGRQPGEIRIELAESERAPGRAAVTAASQQLSMKMTDLALDEASLSSAQL